MAKVSYSQYTVHSTCPKQYKLKYIDNNKGFGNIFSSFGTAMHATMQHYLSIYYTISKRQADEINLEKLFQNHLMDEIKKESDKLPDGEFICTREEIEEFYWQGVEILRWFVKDKNLRKLFQKKGYTLVGIEVPISFKISENISVIGFIDIILRDSNGNIIIIDLKTSTSGWSSWQKNDEKKTNQIILYKVWYSELFKLDISKINVEFHIMRRIMPKDEDIEWPIPRISKFVPASGTMKQNQAKAEFKYFIDEVFDADGNYKIKEYVKKPGKHCSWCDFHLTNGGECDG